MVDLTQRVKYTVEVDSSALASLRLEVNTFAIALENFEKKLKLVATTSKNASVAFGKLAEKMVANAQAASKAEIQLSGLIQAQGEGNTATNTLATNIKGLSETLAAMARNARASSGSLRENNEMMAATATTATKAAKEPTDQGMQFLKMFGKFQALKWIAKETFASIRDGAQQLDLERVLGTQIKNYTIILDDAMKRTAGFASKAALQKEMGLVSSFGIPMERFAESMELVQKAAIRTGQSAEFMTESFGKGVARMSPKILDNLGIQ